MNQVCNYFGYTRQAYYKQRTRQEKDLDLENIILAEVKKIRKRQPMIGGRKIQHILRKTTHDWRSKDSTYFTQATKKA